MATPKQSRKEARAERQNLKRADDEGKRVRLLLKPEIASALIPRIGIDPENIFHQKMTWCVTKKDVDGTWSWFEPRQWTDKEFETHIQQTLDSLSGNTWVEIGLMMRNGLSMHHSQDVLTIHEEAQKRWEHLDIGQDETYRFSLTGRQRAWGYREGSHFRLVWYDRYHTIYKVQKSNT